MKANRRGKLEAVCQYTEPSDATAPYSDTNCILNTITRFLIASALSNFLQWGTIGSAVIFAWFTPTQGLGCRSGAYLLYGIVATTVWFIMVLSSFLSHYSFKRATGKRPIGTIVATILRKLGKTLGTLNAVWIIVVCIFQLSGFFDRCYCNSSVLGLGKNAYMVLQLLPDDVNSLRSASIAANVLSLGSAAIYTGFIYVCADPPEPQPSYK